MLQINHALKLLRRQCNFIPVGKLGSTVVEDISSVVISTSSVLLSTISVVTIISSVVSKGALVVLAANVDDKC